MHSIDKQTGLLKSQSQYKVETKFEPKMSASKSCYLNHYANSAKLVGSSSNKNSNFLSEEGSEDLNSSFTVVKVWDPCYNSFPRLLLQNTTNSVTQNNRHLFFHSFRFQKTKIKILLDHGLFEGSREESCLALPFLCFYLFLTIYGVSQLVAASLLTLPPPSYVLPLHVYLCESSPLFIRTPVVLD